MSLTAFNLGLPPRKQFLAYAPIKVLCTFLETRELGRCEQVNKLFEEVVNIQWKDQYHKKLRLGDGADIGSNIPRGMTVKESLRFLQNNVFDESFYKDYIGDVDPAPQIDMLKFLELQNDPDFCDEEYIFMYVPESITTDQIDAYLSKEDDPSELEAPRLMLRKGRSEKKDTFAKTTLKVPVTLNNIQTLFQFPKKGNPSNCTTICDETIEQHGDKRVYSGRWICMIKNMAGGKFLNVLVRDKPQNKEVILTELLPRTLFNLLAHVRSKNKGYYPDRLELSVFAITSTLVKSGFRTLNAGCGDIGEFGPPRLIVGSSRDRIFRLAVQLSEEFFHFNLRLSNYEGLFTSEELKLILPIVKRTQAAKQFCQEGDLSSARKEFQYSLEQCRKCSDLNVKKRLEALIRIDRAMIFQAIGELELAENELKDVFESVIDRKEVFEKACISYAHVLQARGKTETANQIYEMIKIEYNQNDIGDKKINKALECYRRDLKTFSHFSSVSERYFYLAKIYVTRKQYAQAIDCVNEALESKRIGPISAFKGKCYYELGNIYMEQKRFGRAVLEFQKAIEISQQVDYKSTAQYMASLAACKSKMDELIIQPPR